MLEITTTISIFEAVALLGVAISILWHLATWIGSRKVLTVTLSRGLTMMKGQVQEVFYITVKNESEYTRIIEGVGFRGKTRADIALTPATVVEYEWSVELPKPVPPKQIHIFHIPAKEILNFPAVRYPLKAWVKDSFGKKHSSNNLKYS